MPSELAMIAEAVAEDEDERTYLESVVDMQASLLTRRINGRLVTLAARLLRECIGDATDAFELSKEYADWIATHPIGRGTDFNCQYCLRSISSDCEHCWRHMRKWQRIAIALRWVVTQGFGTIQLVSGPHQRRSGWLRSQAGIWHVGWIVNQEFVDWANTNDEEYALRPRRATRVRFIGDGPLIGGADLSTTRTFDPGLEGDPGQ